MFISKLHAGHVYMASRSRKGRLEFLWTVMPIDPAGGDRRINADQVPAKIRRQAYRLFRNDRERVQRIRDKRETAAASNWRLP